MSHASNFSCQEFSLGLCVLGHISIGYGGFAVALLLAVLRKKDQWCGILGLHGQQQCQQDETATPRIELVLVWGKGVVRNPEDDYAGLPYEESGRTEETGDRFTERPERIVVVLHSDATRCARRAEVFAAPHDSTFEYACPNP